MSKALLDGVMLRLVSVLKSDVTKARSVGTATESKVVLPTDLCWSRNGDLC